jgi:hypothetical protein
MTDFKDLIPTEARVFIQIKGFEKDLKLFTKRAGKKKLHELHKLLPSYLIPFDIILYDFLNAICHLLIFIFNNGSVIEKEIVVN